MSEYQYYHFATVDKPLTNKQTGELRDISTRATITPTSFVNVYNWGDLKADPLELMFRYFDAHVYVTNWMVHRLMLKVPARLIDFGVVKQYASEGLSVRTRRDQTVLDFYIQDRSGDYDCNEYGGDEWLPVLIGLRAEIMKGDLRPFSIAWLASGEHDEDDRVPAVPPGMGRLTAAQRALVEFLFVDKPLLTAAVRTSGSVEMPVPSRQEMERWVSALPAARKDEIIAALLAGEDPGAMAGLHQEFARDWRAEHAEELARGTDPGCTYGDIVEQAGQLHKEEARRQAEKEARARRRRLAELAGREPAEWRRVTKVIESRNAREYASAVDLLRDLHDLARSKGRESGWVNRVKALRRKYSRRSSLMMQFDQAGFPEAD